MNLREEVINHFNDKLYMAIADDDINFAECQRKRTYMINVLNRMLDEVDTGFVSLDIMVSQEILLLIDKIAGNEYSISFNYSGYSPRLEQVTFLGVKPQQKKDIQQWQHIRANTEMSKDGNV